jgi:2'-5' RNA ligase
MGKRLFAAIHIHPDSSFLRRFSELQHKLHLDKIKWVENENLHVTLKFFGETPEEKIPAIISALRNACNQQHDFSLQTGEIGIFGSSYKPRVIWLNLQMPEPFHTLQQSITTELEPLGYVNDRQNFVPHLTLGRINTIKDMTLFQQHMETNRNQLMLTQQAHELILFESILQPSGPVYVALEQFLLMR